MKLWIIGLFVLGLAELARAAQPAGLYVRLNQKAVDYITDLASDAFPAIFNNLSPPDVEADPATISNIHVSGITRPQIEAKFIDGKGVRANVSLPSLTTSGHAKVLVIFFAYEGDFTVHLNDLSILLELHFIHNETTTVEAPVCNVTHSDIVFVFPPGSGVAGLQSQFNDAIVDKLKSLVCETAVEALNFVMAQKPSEVEQVESKELDSEDPNAFSAAELGVSLCKPDAAKSDEDEAEVVVPTSADVLNSTAKSGIWGVDLAINHPPTFSDDDVIIGLDGGITYNGFKSNSTQIPHVLNRTLLDKRMIGILVSEYIPTTLFTHIFENDLGSFKEKFGPSDLPKFVRKLANAVCSKCYLEINANLTEKPRVEIDADLGARVQLAINVSATFMGREQLHDVIHANTRLHVTLKPSIRHSQVYGDVSLTNVDVNVFDLGLGGPLAKPIEKLFSFVVPKMLWPQVKKRLRFALNRRGVKLPVICGVEFEHMTLDYTDHAVVLNTDFTFDLPLFINKFQTYLAIKAQTNKNLPRYVVL